MAEALLQRLTKKERRQAALQFHQQRQQAGEAKQDEALQNRWSSRLRKVRNRITSICQVREGNGVSPPPRGGGRGGAVLCTSASQYQFQRWQQVRQLFRSPAGIARSSVACGRAHTCFLMQALPSAAGMHILMHHALVPPIPQQK